MPGQNLNLAPARRDMRFLTGFETLLLCSVIGPIVGVCLIQDDSKHLSVLWKTSRKEKCDIIAVHLEIFWLRLFF